MTDLTVERLKELLNYDPDTGEFRWKVRRGGKAVAGSVAGGLKSGGYIYIRVDKKHYPAHRLAWLCIEGRWPQDELDHTNLVKSDNRRENLREATRTENNWNRPRRSNNTSGYKGVSYFKRNDKWRAQIKVNGKVLHLGYFDTAEEAAEAYARAAKLYFGEFARYED